MRVDFPMLGTVEISGDITVISPGPSTLDQEAVVIYGGVAPHINSLRVQGAQTGALILGMTRGARVDHFYVRDAYSSSPNLGTAFRCSESGVVFGTGIVENCRTIHFAETDSRVHYENLSYRNVDASDRALFFAASGSRITVDRLHLYGRGGYRLFDFSDNLGGPVSAFNVRSLEIRGELPANSAHSAAKFAKS